MKALSHESRPRARTPRGAPGIDGMNVEELLGYLKQHWPDIRAALVAGQYRLGRTRLGIAATRASICSLCRRLPDSRCQRTRRAERDGQPDALDRPWQRTFLGFTLSRRDKKLKVADKAIDKLKGRVRQLSQRTKGHKVERIVEELRTSLLGWRAYFGITEVRSPLADLDKWIRRRLRCYQWKQWGSRGYIGNCASMASRCAKLGIPARAHTARGASRKPRRSRSPCGSNTSRAWGCPAWLRPAHEQPVFNTANRWIRDPYVRWCERGSP